MKIREKIRLDSDLTEMMFQMSEGNPGALTVLIGLLKDDLISGMIDVLHLDDMGMRGPQIWVAFKDHCKSDIPTFRAALKSRDKEMIATVNRECPDQQAVTGGASFG